jgi:hypothetical protein
MSAKERDRLKVLHETHKRRQVSKRRRPGGEISLVDFNEGAAPSATVCALGGH